jgi:hypothetical protein
MDAAAIAIQRNTVKQHMIMCTRGIKFTQTGPRTAAVARNNRHSPAAGNTSLVFVLLSQNDLYNTTDTNDAIHILI